MADPGPLEIGGGLGAGLGVKNTIGGSLGIEFTAQKGSGIDFTAQKPNRNDYTADGKKYFDPEATDSDEDEANISAIVVETGDFGGKEEGKDQLPNFEDTMKISVSKRGDTDLLQQSAKMPKIVDLADNEDNKPLTKKRIPRRCHTLMRDL